MNSKAIRFSAAIALVAVAAYWYWSPLLAIHQMRSAAKAGDADTFNDHVDYPRLRDSLKGQFSAAIADKASSSTARTDAAKAGEALGAMLGVALIDRMVDSFVRQEVVMRAMQEGSLVPKGEQPMPPQQSSSKVKDGIDWSYERKGVDRYVAYALKSGEPEGNKVGLVFERTGFATWRLTEIRLPAFK